MRKFVLFLATFLVVLPALASAQWVGPISITSNQCASIGAEMNATVVAYVSGTWTGTLQPQGTIQGQAPFNVLVTPSTSSTTQATVTASGAYTTSIAGYSTFQLCGATVASGAAVVYLNASMAETGSGGGGAASFTTLAGGTNNVNASHIEGSGSSLSASGTGQVAGTQLWQDDGLTAPTISFGLAGGSFANGRSTSIRYTFVTAAGQTYPSIATSGGNGSFGCSSGTTCQLTVTAPTLPSGITGYSVYAQDCGASPCGGSETLQAACTNIVINCVLNSVGGGAAVPTANTAYLQPSPLLTSECPAGTIPNWFIKDNDGNWHTQAGIDPTNTASLPPTPYGTLTFCRRTWFNDSLVGGPAGKNSFVAIFHTPGIGVGVGQDRALHVEMDNASVDSTSYYGWEGIQSQVVVSGTPNFTGTPDGEESAGSFQTNMLNTNSMTGGSYGPNAVRAQIFRNGVGGSVSGCTYCYRGLNAIATNGATGSLAGGVMAAITALATDQGGCSSCAGIGVAILKGTRFTTYARGLFLEDFGTNTADWNIFSSSTNGTPTSGRNWFGGNVYFANLITAAKEIAVTGSLVASGSVSSAAFATPSFNNGNVTNIGATGATTDTYKITAVDGNGKESSVSAAGTTTTANATLNGTNFNRINLNAPTLVIGVGSYKVYRTAAGGTPSTTGLIGTITITNTTLSGASFTLDDTGLAGDGSTPPTQSLTGAVQAPLYDTTTICAAVGTAASPSVASCTAAPAGSFSCATNATGATCTVNTTAVTTISQIFVQEDETLGTRLGVSCNTGTNVLPASRLLNARVAGTSFTINLGTVTTNPACFSYFIIN